MVQLHYLRPVRIMMGRKLGGRPRQSTAPRHFLRRSLTLTLIAFRTGEFAFGEAFHCLDCGGEYHFFVKTVFDGVVSGLRMMMLEHYGILTLMKPFIPESAFKPKEDMDKYTRELVDRRVERGYIPGTADVSIYLLQNKDAGDQLSKAAMYENGVTLVVAGSETTGTLLTGTTYFLCKHPETLRKVQDEVRSAFKSDSEITYKSVNDLTYMIAALSETMRIFPPTGFGFPRHISAKEGQTVAGHYVPHKVRVFPRSASRHS